MDPISPVFRNIMTDIADGKINHQLQGVCAKFELRSMECLEAYGLDRGKRKCKDLLDDLRECTFKDKQYRRIELMHLERLKQIKEGKIDPNSTKNDPHIASL